jgi:hypothetical protein
VFGEISALQIAIFAALLPDLRARNASDHRASAFRLQFCCTAPASSCTLQHRQKEERSCVK